MPFIFQNYPGLQDKGLFFCQQNCVILYSCEGLWWLLGVEEPDPARNNLEQMWNCRNFSIGVKASSHSRLSSVHSAPLSICWWKENEQSPCGNKSFISVLNSFSSKTGDFFWNISLVAIFFFPFKNVWWTQLLLNQQLSW